MEHPISLRSATPADEEFLLLLRKLTMTSHLERAGEPTDEQAHIRRVRFRFDAAQIICRGADAIGLLKAARTGTEWFIFQIQVLPEFQGRGFGTEAIGLILADAKRAGSCVSLMVLKENPALHLYLSLGFQHISDTEIEFKLTCYP